MIQSIFKKDVFIEQKYSQLINNAKCNQSAYSKDLKENYKYVSQLFHSHYDNISASIQFILIVLSCQESYAYLLNQKQNSILQLLDSLSHKIKSNSIMKLVKNLVDGYTTIYQGLVLQSIWGKYFIGGLVQDEVIRQLPFYIRLCGLNAQNYIKLLNEPTKGQEDRTQYDKPIIKYGQQWMKQSIMKYFQQFPPYSSWQIMMGLMNFQGAILQAIREQKMKRQILNKILDGITTKLTSLYSLQRIHNEYINRLKRKRYNSQYKQIRVEEQYNEDTEMNIIAYCYNVLYLIKNGGIYTDNRKVYYLLSALGEIVLLPHQFKIQILNLVEESNQVHIANGVEGQYLVTLLLFRVYLFSNQKYQSLNKKFLFQSQALKFRALRNLHSLKIGHQNQLEKFILEELLKNLKVSIEYIKLFSRLKVIDSDKYKQVEKRIMDSEFKDKLSLFKQ